MIRKFNIFSNKDLDEYRKELNKDNVIPLAACSFYVRYRNPFLMLTLEKEGKAVKLDQFHYRIADDVKLP